MSCETTCEFNCPVTFEYVMTSVLIAGGTKVQWALHPMFLDPGPYTFLLQVSDTMHAADHEWEAVGFPSTNTYYAVDPDRRATGLIDQTWYRIQLNTPSGEYFSEPVNAKGVLDHRDRRIAEYMLKNFTRMRHQNRETGYLLKKRTSGAVCPTCIDAETGEATRSDCPDCWGTGYRCGYFYPRECVPIDVSPRSMVVQGNLTRGMSATVTHIGITRGDFLPMRGDVFVNKYTDVRYTINRVNTQAKVKSFPLIVAVDLVQASFGDIIYEIPIPQKLLEMADG